MLSIENLTVEVQNKVILKNITLNIPRGETHILFGPNGSGKTTLLMAIMGFSGYKVTQGRIFFDGQDITELDLTERARLGIGVAQQRPPTIAGVKLQQVLDYATARNMEDAQTVQALTHKARMDPFVNRDINAGLSGGEIRRSEILQLLVTRPRFAMMDEPDSGVDVEALELLGEMVNRLFSKDPKHPVKRRAGLIITHTGQILDYVDADKAHVMMKGRIACSGNPNLIFSTVCESGYEECVRCVNGQGV